MSSKPVNPHNKNLPSENSNKPTGQHRLLSSHHVRHHSYDPASNSLGSQIFPPSRLNRKENPFPNNNHNNNNNNNPVNENSHSHFLPSHRHTSSYASDQSSFTNLNSNHYHQHHYSASQENLRRKFFFFRMSKEKTIITDLSQYCIKSSKRNERQKK